MDRRWNLGPVLQVPDFGRSPKLSQQAWPLPAALSVRQNRI